MSSPVVRAIQAEETIGIRLAILRPGLPRESAIFPGDDAASTRHLGAFERGELVGVASIYEARLPERLEVASAWQLRGMASVPEVRGRGIGRALLAAALAEATKAGGTLLWCNARISAVGFYHKHGFQTIGAEFVIPTAGPHMRLWVELPAV